MDVESPATDVESYVKENILRDGEEILWKGRPDPNRLLTRAVPRFVFGVIFFAFAIFWTYSTVARSGIGFLLFGAPFLAVGAWVMSLPLRERRRAGWTYYAVTDRRVLIIETCRRITTTPIMPGNITDLERVDRPDGTGDLQFRRTAVGRRGQRRQTNFHDGFWGVSDIRGAADTVARLLEPKAD